MNNLEPPERSFAGDNFGAAHPAVIEAIVAANSGYAPAYGADDLTARAETLFDELFDHDVAVRFVFNGTGANLVSLGTLMATKPGAHHAIVCSNRAHIFRRGALARWQLLFFRGDLTEESGWEIGHTDETGGPERLLAAKLLDLPSEDGKITPEQLRDLASMQGSVRSAQPGIVSLTQPTELGVMYTAAEIAALCDVAHEMGMLVHLDGARIANAAAAAGGSREALRRFTVDAGVDVVSFGLTKTGAIGAEAAIFLNRDVEAGSLFVQKQLTQLPSKMRYLSAQFVALLEDDLWITLGAQANEMAQMLHGGVTGLGGVDAGPAPQANSIYPFLPAAVVEPLRDWSFFWYWNVSRHQVRWMTGWDTTAEDVERFTAGVRHFSG